MDSMNIFSDARQSLLLATGPRLLVANDLGLVKVIDWRSPEDEPEIIETLDSLAGLKIHHNLLATVTADGELMLYTIDKTAAKVFSSIKCYRSELALRDITFLSDTHLVVAGDNNELAVVSIAKYYNQQTKSYTLSNDGGDNNDVFDRENISQIGAADQVRSLSFNIKTNTLAVSLASGDIQFYKFNNNSDSTNSKVLEPVGKLFDFCNKYIFIPDSDPNTIDSLAQCNVSWNPISNSYAIANKAKDIMVFDDSNFKGQDPKFILSGPHKQEIVELQWCPFNYGYLASIDHENRVVVWDVLDKKPIFNKKVVLQDAKLKNVVWNLISSSGDNGNYGDSAYTVLSVGSTSGDIFTAKSIVEPNIALNNLESAKDKQGLESNGEKSAVSHKYDFQETEDNEFDLSDDDDLFKSPTANNNGTTSPISTGLNGHKSNGTRSSLKRSRADFESDSEIELSDNDDDGDSDVAYDNDDELRAIEQGSVLPSYRLKPYSVGASPWFNNQRYLTINAIGCVYCEKNMENNTQIVNVKFFENNGTSNNSNSNNDYYFIDSVGFDLAYLTEEGLLLASSAYIDKSGSVAAATGSADVFGTSLHNIKTYKQAKVYYRPHKDETNSWEKILPIKNYYQNGLGGAVSGNNGGSGNLSEKNKFVASHEFITNINLSKKYIFIFTNLGHTRILTKFGLLVKIEKSMPVVCSISNNKILFTIATSKHNGGGREFYFSIRDLLTTTQHHYIEQNQLLPLDYIPNRLLSDANNEKNFDKLLAKFDAFEKKNSLIGNDDFNSENGNGSSSGSGAKNLIDTLVYRAPCYVLKGLYFTNFGDPCIVDNSNYVYVLTKWKKANQGQWIPVLNLNEVLYARPNLNYVPISLVDDKFNVVLFNNINSGGNYGNVANAEYLYPKTLPEQTELTVKIPINWNVDMKVLKEQQKAARKAGKNNGNDDYDDDINGFIEKDDDGEDDLEDDLDDDDDDVELMEDSEDEEQNRDFQKQLETEEQFLRAKMMTELINEALESHTFFEKTVAKKFKTYHRSKRILDMANTDGDDYYLNELDLNLSDNEIDNNNNDDDDGESYGGKASFRLKNTQFSVNESIDKLQELNATYDKTLLKMFSELCTAGGGGNGDSEYAKAVGLVKEMKQDRALIAASRIAERLELSEVAAKIAEEREKRMQFD